jgi:hypothetical protein
VAKGTRCWRIEQPLRGLRPRLAGEGFRPIPPCRWLEDQAQFSSCTRTPRGRSRRPRAKEADRPRPRDQARTRSRVQRLETHRRTSKVVTHGGRRCCQLPVRRVKLRAIALQLVRAVRTCVRGCGGVPVRGVRRAVEARNLTRAIAEARDLPQISLVDAAEVVVLAADDPRTIFQSVGWTTAARYVLDERNLTLGEAQLMLTALAGLRHGRPARLGDRARRGFRRAQPAGARATIQAAARDGLERSRGTEDSAAPRRGSRVRRAGSLFRA